MIRSTKRTVFFRMYLFFCSYIRVCFQLDTFVREHVWHKALLMWYSMRLELTRVCILNDFQLVIGFFYEGRSFLLLECISLNLLNPSFTFDICTVCVCVCVCVLEWFRISLIVIVIFSLCVCVCVCVLEWFRISLIIIFSLCVCVCVYECLDIFWVYIYIYIYIYIYMYVYTFVCLFPFVCVCTTYVIFNFGLNLSIKFFSFI